MMKKILIILVMLFWCNVSFAGCIQGNCKNGQGTYTWADGDNVGILLRGLKREEIERGQVICKPGSITPHTKFKGQVYVLDKDEGGRHTPFFSNYRPQFYFRTTDLTGVVALPSGVEMVMPGDNVEVSIELINPIAMEKEVRFAIREGGRTIGSGVVTEVIE